MPAPKVKFASADELTDDPKNARDHSDAQIEHVAGLIRRFGWTRPIQVDCADGNMIVVGHGARKAAQLIYAEEGVIYLAPGEARGGSAIPKGRVPIMDVSGWTEEERRAVNLSDNRSGELSTWNAELLEAGLAELGGADFTMAEIGFSSEAMAEISLSPPPGAQTPATAGELSDSTFNYQEQFAVIIRCKDAVEQEARFRELSDKYGADDCKVVVV